MINRTYCIIYTLTFMALLQMCHPWCLRTTVNLTTSVDKVDWAIDGTYLAVTSSAANTVTVYDTINYFNVLTYTPAGGTARVARFNRNSSILAVGVSNGRVDLLSGKPPFSSTPITTFSPHNKNTVDLGFNYADDKLLTCYSDDDKFKITDNWSLSSRTTREKDIGDRQMACKWSKNDDVAIANDDKKVQVYAIPAAPGVIGGYMTRIAGSKDYTDVAIRPTIAMPIKVVASGGNNNQISAAYFSNTGGGATVASTTLSPNTAFSAVVNTACYSPTADVYAVGGEDRKTWIIDDSSNTQSAVLSDGLNTVKNCDFSQDGQYLAVGTLASSSNAYVLIYARICQFCSVGFYRDEYACLPCSSAISYCSMCYNGTYCVDCNRGHYLTSTVTCTSCATTMEGCSTCNNSTYCIECNHGFYLTATNVCSQCAALYPGCLICSLSTCILCQHDYYLSGANCLQCSVSIQNCMRCQSNSICLHCASGYYPASSGSLCSPCAEGCVICSITDSNCSLCSRGYYYINETCSLCAVNCLDCSQTQCFDCSKGYHTINGSASCSSCAQECATCYNQSICWSCLPGYFLNLTEGCLSCINNCSTCRSLTNCTSCMVGYYLTTTDTCLSCAQQFLGCQQCRDGVCLACSQGYYLLSSTQCDVCENAMPGCQYCADSNSCEECAVGYFHTGAVGFLSCMLCPEQCEICSDLAVCSECITGFYLNGNICTRCTSPCLTCNTTDTQCLSCQMGYYFDLNSSCLPCTNLFACNSCQDNLTCTDCLSGYYLNSTNLCQSCFDTCTHCNSTDCFSCNVGYYLSTATTCLQCPMNCSICASATDCNSCDVGYYLDTALTTNQCVSCNVLSKACLNCNKTDCYSCFNGYYLDSSNQCQLCSVNVVNCLICSATACDTCQDGYYLASPTSCVECTSLYGCMVCSNASTCLLCASGYYLDSGSCQPCPDQCSACSSNATCTVCDSSSYLSNNTCLHCQDVLVGCVSCTDAITCLSCAGGYLLNLTQQCQPCSLTLPACSLCDSTTLLCQSCQQGYYLSTLFNCLLCSSSPSLAGCLLCNSSTVCQKCNSGYYLSTGSCILCESSLPACQQCSSATICLDCSGGYYLNGTSYSCLLCQSNIPGCIFCLDQTTCNQCQGGYYLSGGVCQPCTGAGCEVCNATIPANCITCNSGYYLFGSTCAYCSQVGCTDCNSTDCLSCNSGYYLTSGLCTLCSIAMDGCTKCSSAGVCLECQSLFYLDNLTCTICSQAMLGCSFCTDNSSCLACDGGYYLANATCFTCSDIVGCLICSNSSYCLTCTAAFFQVNSTCSQCSLSIEHCFQCTNESYCLSCESGYQVSDTGTCTAMKMATGSTTPVSGSTTLTFKSQYVNASCLRHALAVADKSAVFEHIDSIDWTSVVKIYVEDKTVATALTLLLVQLSPDQSTLYFYTDNPLQVSSTSMPLTDKGRILVGQSMSTLNMQASLSLPKTIINNVLPSILVTSDLSLSYSLKDSTFYVTYVRQSFTMYYFVFGVVIVLFSLVYGLSRASCLGMYSRNLEFYGHVLALKSMSLVVFPTYAEYVNFCLGFMAADLPWLNNKLPDIFGNQFDLAPTGYYFYFRNMNFASMHLFTLLIFLLFLGIAYLSLNENKAKVLKIDNSKSGIANFKFKAFKQFVMNFFGFGLAFAGFSSVVGVYLNSSTTLTLNGILYILGIVVYGGVACEAVACCILNRRLCRLRVILKATFLAGAGLSPLYMASMAMIADLILLLIEYSLRKDNLLCPKTWLTSQLLLLTALIAFYYIPDSFLTLGITMTLTLLAYAFEIYYFTQEKKLSQQRHKELFEQEQNFATGDPFQKLQEKSYSTHDKDKESASPDGSPGKDIIFEEASMEGDGGLRETKFIQTRTTHFNPQNTKYAKKEGDKKGRTRKFKQAKGNTQNSWNMAVFDRTNKDKEGDFYFEQ